MGGTSSHRMNKPVTIAATAKHTATVIFLHGLGDTGHGWASMFEAMRQPHIKYVCPTAPVQPVTLNMGMPMPSWFDIKGLDINAQEDSGGIKKASALLQAMIREEEKQVPRGRILLGGFSQGGALALYSALAEPQSPLAGIVALSTWLPLNSTKEQWAQSNREIPILQCHGKQDPMVRYEFGAKTKEVLASFLPNHTFKDYEGLGHSSCEEELQDVNDFVKRVLPPI